MSLAGSLPVLGIYWLGSEGENEIGEIAADAINVLERPSADMRFLKFSRTIWVFSTDEYFLRVFLLISLVKDTIDGKVRVVRGTTGNFELSLVGFHEVYLVK